MNWDAIGAIGQAVSALALVVVIVQVRHARSESRRAILQDRTQLNNQINLTLATNQHLVALRVKANDAVHDKHRKPPFMEAATKQLGLTPEEVYMLYVQLRSAWSSLAQSVLYVDELNSGDRAQIDRSIRNALLEPIFQFWYDCQKSVLNPDAVRYVDNVLAQLADARP